VRQHKKLSSWELCKAIFPILFILLAYASLRSLEPILSNHVHYTLMPNFDRKIFGTLPTITLQHWLWHGTVTWYDYALYGVYVSHYILLIFLAWLVYTRYRQEYVRLAMTYILATLGAFAVFIIYPTAPPWLASQNGYIPHITRISSAVFSSIGVHNFPALYSSYAPNPVAAAPSLHTTYSVLFVLFIYRYFGKRWAVLSLIYPICIIFGVVYLGEHYVFDILGGIVLAIASFLATPLIIKYTKPSIKRLALKLPLAQAGSTDKND
jgi:membrane-associated phospholipid phosphatase